MVLYYNTLKETNGELAQLGERLPYKQRVRGSSPLLSTIFLQVSSKELFFYLLRCSMEIFLTSSPCVEDPLHELPCILSEEGAFASKFKEAIQPNGAVMIIAGDPYNDGLNDEMSDTFYKCFKRLGLSFSGCRLVDHRQPYLSKEDIAQCSLIMLAGGHVPTQNQFFHEIGLKALLQDYQGVILGVSAGSMNAATYVYSQPECPGEALDPHYPRWMEGLGLCNINILPHYNDFKGGTLDGMKIYEEIVARDSLGHCFYILKDGSYVHIKDGIYTLYSEIFEMKNGEMKLVCEMNASHQLESV